MHTMNFLKLSELFTSISSFSTVLLHTIATLCFALVSKNKILAYARKLQILVLSNS